MGFRQLQYRSRRDSVAEVLPDAILTSRRLDRQLEKMFLVGLRRDLGSTVQKKHRTKEGFIHS